MGKFDLKGYKEKFDKVKSDKSRDFKKMQEDENVDGFNQLLSAYTDVVDEEKDKEYNLFHYGIVRNPETEKTIIGVKEDEEGNYIEFIVDHIDIDDVIGMVQSADEKFEELFDGISKDEIIQRIYNNEGFVAPIINAIFFTGNGGEEYNYEDEITMDKETLEEYLENDSYESNEIDDYEFSYDENGEIEDIEEKKSHADVMPESRDYSNIEDEFYFMNGYKVVFKDDKGNCRLFESKKNERLAKIYAENLAKDLKERNFDKDGSRVSIIAPFSIDEENVIKLDESVISLKEELEKKDMMNEEEEEFDFKDYVWDIKEELDKLASKKQKSKLVEEWIDKFFTDFDHYLIGDSASVLSYMHDVDKRKLESENINQELLANDFFFEIEQAIGQIKSRDDWELSDWIDLYDSYIREMEDVIRVLEDIPYEDLQLNSIYDNTNDKEEI